MRLALIAALLVVVAGCESAPGETPAAGQGVGVGTTAKQVEACLGPPTAKDRAGATETWTYRAPGETISPGSFLYTPGGNAVLAGRGRRVEGQCTVTLVLREGAVAEVGYESSGGSLLSVGRPCPISLSGCRATQ